MNIFSEDIHRYFNFDKRLYFIVLCLLILFNGFMMREMIMTEDLFYRTYGEQVATERIESYLEMRDKFKWLAYALIPIVLLIKLSLVSVCINVGTLSFGEKTGFVKIFKVVLIAEIVFITATLVRTFYLMLFVDIEVIPDIQQFYPLSVANILNPADFPGWLSYPLLTANLFEVIYILVLSVGMVHVLKKDFSYSLSLVAYSYGIGLLIWTVIIVFLTINFT